MLSKKITTAVPLADMQLLVFFENGVIKKFDVGALRADYPEFCALEEPALFQQVRVEPGGYGVSWNEELDCSEGELWDSGIEIPLSMDDFVSFVQCEVINTSEAAALKSCTRQNIESSVRRGNIAPIKAFNRTKLFLKSAI